MPIEEVDDAASEVIGEDEAEDILLLATLIGIGPGDMNNRMDQHAVLFPNHCRAMCKPYPSFTVHAHLFR